MKCCRGSCENLATWEPGLRVFAEGDPDSPAVDGRCIGLGVCEAHKEMLEASDLVSDENWEQISKAFRDAGKAPPDRERVEIIYRPLAGEG